MRGKRARDTGPELTVVEDVRCLSCGTVYAKPSYGGTAKANPGCPNCGYVGWLAARLPLRREKPQRRSGEDLRQDRSAQSR
jgi:hypothetical protein